MFAVLVAALGATFAIERFNIAKIREEYDAKLRAAEDARRAAEAALERTELRVGRELGAAAAELDWSDAVFSAPTAAATAAKAQNTQLASALLLPLFAYKVGALINGVKLQWYLDATIAFAAVSLVVFASK